MGLGGQRCIQSHSSQVNLTSNLPPLISQINLEFTYQLQNPCSKTHPPLHLCFVSRANSPTANCKPPRRTRQLKKLTSLLQQHTDSPRKRAVFLERKASTAHEVSSNVFIRWLQIHSKKSKQEWLC